MSTLAKRTFSSVILLSLLAGSVFLPIQIRIWFFVILCSFLGFGSSFECCEMLNGAGKNRRLTWFVSISILFYVLVLIASTFVQLNSIIGLRQEGGFFRIAFGFDSNSIFGTATALFAQIPVGLIVALIFWFLILKSCKNADKLRSVISSAAVFFLFSLSLGLIVQIYFKTGNVFIRALILDRFDQAVLFPDFFLFFILVTKCGDIGAYLVGTLANTLSHGNNHKLVPSISPAKSWEGMFGGLALSIIVSVSLAVIFKGANTIWMIAAVVMGILLYFGGMAGDLAESSLKRTCGVKDSGHFLPGIGGLFDLVDSLMINAVVFVLSSGILVVLYGIVQSCFFRQFR